MVAGVWSDNSSLQLEATTQFRKLLSIGTFMCISLCYLFVFLFVLFCYESSTRFDCCIGDCRTKPSH